MTKILRRILGFDVVIIEDETGGYVAYVPALLGCHTQGDTIEEIIENIKEAIELYLEAITEEENKAILSQETTSLDT